MPIKQSLLISPFSPDRESKVLVTQLCLNLRPHGLQTVRLLCPGDSTGKSTGVDCHFMLQRGLPHPGMETGSPLQADSLLSEPPDHGSPDHGSHQSVCMDLPSLDNAYKWNHAICGLFLMFFTQLSVFMFYHVLEYINTSFHLMTKQHFMVYVCCILFIHLSIFLPLL